MSIRTVLHGDSIQADDGTVDDDELHRYIWTTGRPVHTTEPARRFNVPRTTLWDALSRLQADGRVERVGPQRQGVSALWRARPPDWQQLPGPEFAHLRKNAGITQTGALDHLAARLDDDQVPSRSQFSKFENSEYQTDLDADARRELYELYQREGGPE